jgi:hypothetical protein
LCFADRLILVGKVDALPSGRAARSFGGEPEQAVLMLDEV